MVLFVPTEKKAPILYSFRDLHDLGVRLSLPQLWRLERAGKFPKRFNISAGRIAWLAAEIEAYIHRCAAARDGGAPIQNMPSVGDPPAPMARRRGRPPGRGKRPAPTPPTPAPAYPPPPPYVRA